MQSRGSDTDAVNNIASAHPSAQPHIPDTRWYPGLRSAAIGRALPSADRAWLIREGSLTRHLQALCRADLSVSVLHEGFGLPGREECRRLGIPQRQHAWIREVALIGDGEPWVLARTVIPRATLLGAGRRLRHLGRKPLGAYLFSSSYWHRGSFEIGICRANPGNIRVARRSRFCHRDGSCLIVGEYFLPALLNLCREG